MMQSNKRTKRWSRKRVIRHITIVYLCVMAGLTFCSAWIQKAALPEVMVETARIGYLDEVYYRSMVRTAMIQQDDKGNEFIWKVESRNTPLGVRYFVRSVPISVLASDEDWSAVEGALDEETWLVSWKEESLKNGQQVKVAE